MRLIAILLCSVACAKSVPVPAGLGEPCVGNNDCAAGFLCAAGRCVLPANLGGCEPDRKRCNGADVEQCDHNGLSWAHLESCGTGCSAGACNPLACTPGKTRCEGNAAEQCSPDGAAWALVQICPSLCSADTGRCRAPVCTPFSTRCDPSGATSNAQICDSYGAGWQDLACAGGQVCDSGRCMDVLCSAGQTRCSLSGGSVETCNPKSDGWVPAQTCGIRCAASAGVAACVAPACAAGDLRCSPTASSAVEQCLPDRSGWGFVTFCATGCTSSAPGAASCAPVVCAPLSRRCAATGSGVETCRADGTAWTLTDTCPQSCASGSCVTSSAGCNTGDLRCNAADAQLCAPVAGSPGVTQWVTQATCVAGCSSGACLPGGSCAAQPAGQSSVTLTAAASSAPGDGISTVLVYSSVIAGPDGAPLPDGLDFSIAATAAGAPQSVLVSAGGAVATLRIQSLAGRVHFLVRAPALAGGADQSVTLSATLLSGASCAGSTSILFTAAPSQTVLVGEDFTLPAERNLAIGNPANWDTSRGALIAGAPAQVGQGEDGPLSVSATTNLSGSYAPAFAVLGLSGNTATLDSSAPGLNGGDEVLLWDVQGSASGISNAGAYEFLHIASRDGARVTFLETPAGTYGSANDDDVSTQRVQLVRVPHFSSLAVAAGATLTANAWDGSKGGALVFRVSGTATVLGNIAMDAAGFRGGRQAGYGEDVTGLPSLTGAGAGGYSSGGSYGGAGTGSFPGQLYGLPLLGRLHLGAGGGGGNNPNAGGAGGGAIAIFAGSISLANGALAQSGRIHADGGQGQSTAGGGAGGSVWISAQTLAIGTGAASPASAQGGAGNGGGAGGAGRVRFDYVAGSATDVSAGCARAAPGCSFGVGGPLAAQSLDVFDLTDAQKGLGLAIKSATLALTLGASASYQASATSADPPDFGAPMAAAPSTTQFRADATSPAQGTRFRWRVLLTPPPGPAQVLLGMQWSLQVN
jgi:hypothetical protein